MNKKKFFAPSATALGGAVVGDASKRCNQRTVTLGGVTHYVRRAAMALAVMMLTTLTAWAQEITYYPTAGTEGNSGESYDKLFDGIKWDVGNTGNKWCVEFYYYDVDEDYPIYVEFHTNVPIIPTGYVLTTGNDSYTHQSRNPKSWKILAKANSSDSSWDVLDYVTDDETMYDSDYRDFTFNITNAKAYQYFRFEVSEIQNYYNYNEGVFQLSEFAFVATVATSTDPTDLNYATVDGIDNYYLWTGNAIDLNYSVTAADGTQLTEGTHYTSSLTDSNNTSISKTGGVYQVTDRDTYTLTITAKEGNGTYTGSKTVTITVGDGYTYIDANGNLSAKVPGDVTVLDNDLVNDGKRITLPGGWYVITGYMNISGLTFRDDVNLILAEDANADIELRDTYGYGIEVNGELTIYGQSAQGGSISIYGYDYGIYAGGVNIYGGNVSVYGGSANWQNTNGFSGIRAGNVNFFGGNLNAQGGHGDPEYGGSDGYGIEGSVTISWRNSSDRFYASSIDCNYMTIANGKYMKDEDGNVYYGTLTDAQISAIAGKTLQPSIPFEQTGENEYTIRDAGGWSVFCDLLANNASGYFTGKTVKLGANIGTAQDPITRMAGSSGHEFCGTFDGDGKTLTVNITDTENQGTAPFRFISNATIRNLHVTGTVTGTTHAAGLVGKASAGTILIENCLVEANVNSTVGNNRHCGGIVGHGFGGNNPVNLTLRNCVYAGTITCDKNYIGGLQGWSDGNTLTLENCLFAGNYQGTATGTATFHPIALHNTGSATSLTATNVFAAVAPTATNANFIAADGTKATGRTTAPAGLGTQGATYNYMNMTVYEHGLLYNGLYYVAPTLSTDTDNAYLINNEDDWDNFCDALYDNGTWNRFSGQTVKLANDISVSRMAGYDYHDFCGTFDGGGHTLTFNATATDNYLAPFRNVLGNSSDDHAVIHDLNVVTTITADDYRHAGGLIAEVWGYVDVVNCNVTANITATKGNQTELYPSGLVSQVVSGAQLTVSGCTVGGTISTDGKYAGGIIGIVQGSASITNSACGVTINSSTDGDGTHGGLVAISYPGSTNIEGCLFNGKLLTVGTTDTKNCGGFVGWRNTGSVTISNSLYAPADLDNGETEVKFVEAESHPNATFVRNGVSSITNSYYTRALGTAQGLAARTIAAGENVTVAHAGVATVYDVSHITAYKATAQGTTFTPGLLYNNVLYAGSGEAVSLTLTNTPPTGYTLDSYAASPDGATLTEDGDNYTLTMPDANVTITATFSLLSVAYIDENGQQQFCTEYTVLTGNETDLAGGWYVVSSDINYTGTVNLSGDVHLILKDNAVMNVGTVETPINGHGISGNGHSISIYAQSMGESQGQLHVNTSSNYGIYATPININGGQVTTNIIEAEGVTINGGQVTADLGIISYQEVTINGGQVTANSIITYNGGIELGWSNASDFIFAGGYDSHDFATTIADGKAFIDEDNTPYSGTINKVNGTYPIDGKTLYPAVAVTLSEGITAVSGIIASGDDNYAKVGETVTVSATAPLGYTATVTYTPEGGEATAANDLGNGTYSFTMPAANVSVDTDALHSTGLPVSVTYMNADGTTGTHDAIALDGTETMPLAASWYYIGKDINYSQTVSFQQDDITLILGDGKTMSIGTDANHRVNYGIKNSSSSLSLTIYGQSLNDATAGHLDIYASYSAIKVPVGYTQHSGNVTINGAASYSYANGILSDGDITISGGTLDISCDGNVLASYGGNISILGGKLNATYTGHYGLYAIQCTDGGDITLGWTNATDFIYASSYNADGTVNIASGKPFIDDDGNIYSGTINKVNGAYPIAGKMLHPFPDCMSPMQLTTTNITTTQAMLSWSGVQDSYNVRYRTAGTDNYNFFEGFENVEDELPEGWTFDDDYYYNYEIVSGGYNSTYCLNIFDSYGKYLITPKMDLSGQGEAILNFWYRNIVSGASVQFEVYYRTEEDDDAWILLWSSEGGHAKWTEKTIDLPELSADYQIGFYIVDGGPDICFDDISITGTSLHPIGEWQTIGNIADTTTTLTSLSSETTYQWQVQGLNCDGEGSTTEWSEAGYFTTPNPCEAPSELTATDITATTATLSWSGVQDSYVVIYRTADVVAGTLLNEDFEGYEYLEFPEGWTNDNNAWYVNSYYHHSDEKSVETNESDSFLITPELEISENANVVINFWYITEQYGEATPQLEVYYRSAEFPEVWMPLWSSEGSHTDWTEASIAVEDWGNIQLGFKVSCSQRFDVYLDDITVTSYTGYGEWQTIDGLAATTTTLTGLTPEMPYQWQVRGISEYCPYSHPEWSERGTFTTNSVLELADNDSEKPVGEKNADLISGDDGTAKDVMLVGRTLWKDGYWNTLVLPFSMNAGQVTAQLAPTELKELDTEHKWANVDGQWTVSENGQMTGLDNGTLYLNFKDAEAISAGVPYIIKWSSSDNIVDPVFSGVAIVSGAPTAVTFTGGKFVGTYDYTQYTNENKSILLLGEDNTLYYPQPAHEDPEDETSAKVYPSIGAFRAYFQLDDPASVRAFKLNFGDGEQEAQGIKEIEDGRLKIENEAGAWYDLQGRRMESSIFNSQSSIKKKGLYIHNGRKVVVK